MLLNCTKNLAVLLLAAMAKFFLFAGDINNQLDNPKIRFNLKRD